MSELALYARLDEWLALLCQDWRLPSPWCGWLGDRHSIHAVLLVRPA